VSRPALRPTQPPIQWVPGIKRGRGVTLTTHPHIVPRSKMSRSYASPPWRLHGHSGTAFSLHMGSSTYRNGHERIRWRCAQAHCVRFSEGAGRLKGSAPDDSHQNASRIHLLSFPWGIPSRLHKTQFPSVCYRAMLLKLGAVAPQVDPRYLSTRKSIYYTVNPLKNKVFL
jgi:hypothetical protein